MPAEATLEFKWGVVVHNRTNGTKTVTPAGSMAQACIAASVFIAMSGALSGATRCELKDGTVRLTDGQQVIDVYVEGRLP